MARRKSPIPIEKITLNLYAGDFARLQTMYPRAGGAKAARELIRAHLRTIDEAKAQIPSPAPIHIEDVPDER